MKLRIVLLLLVGGFLICGVNPAIAAGPHDANCVECHNIHYAKGDFIIGAEPNNKVMNPATNRTADGIDSLCLGCHNDDEDIMPIHLATTHPTGVSPTYVKVPKKLLRGGKFSCVSCHNPHPSNANYKYLITDTDQGGSIGKFCAVCHTEQADQETVESAGAAVINAGPQVTPRVKISK